MEMLMWIGWVKEEKDMMARGSGATSLEEAIKGVKERMVEEKGTMEAKEDFVECHFGAKAEKAKVKHSRRKCATSVERLVILHSFAPKEKDKDILLEDSQELKEEEKEKQRSATNAEKQSIWQHSAGLEVSEVWRNQKEKR